MERRHLEYLVAIHRHGGFARAANELHVTQSALSQAISQLERELGVELFHRRVRPVRLTATGEAVLEPARAALHEFAAVHEAASAVAGLLGGYLDVASLPTLAQWPATPLVAAYRRKHPGVRVHIMGPAAPRTEELAVMIRQGHCEVGLTERGTHTDGLTESSLDSHDYVAVMPPHTRLSSTGTVSYEEVLSLGIIVGPWWETSRPYQVIRHACGDAADEAVVIRIDHRETYVPLVVSGAGAAILPRFVGELAQAAGATIAELERPIVRDLVLVHRRAKLTPAAEAFADLARALPNP